MTSRMKKAAMLGYLRDMAGESSVLSFANFVRHVLYAPEIGYYQKEALRVGRGPKTDFYTSTTQGPVFGRLVVAAATKLLHPKPPGDYAFVEIGAEPGKAILENVDNPFAQTKVFRLGDAIQLPEKAVVFSNEWLDAQPFIRLRFTSGEWREIGVLVEGDVLAETYLREPGAESQKIISELPVNTAEGYTMDLSLEAESLLSDVLRSSWKGLFLTFDYGKSWEELLNLHPKGTARAYRNHEQQANLLDRPGEQDLTCHLCWDRLNTVMKENGLSRIGLESQESFFMHWAEEELGKIIYHAPGRFDASRNALREILHPNQMGRVFQVLFGTKRK